MLKIKDVRKMDINQRHKMILDAIVSMYIKNGEPVASQTLQDALNIRVSSATLRNEMAMLTKLGYLNQPHVSAGRVPTNKAYRYYVSNIDKSRKISPKDREKIELRFDALDKDSARFLPGAAKLFSDLLGYTVIISPPRDKELQFVNFTAVKTGRFTVAFVATTTRGEVQTRVVKLSNEISTARVAHINQIINARLCFVCYDDIDRRYFRRLTKQLEKENPAYAQLLQGALALIADANNKSLYVYGQEKLLNTSHFDKNIGDMLKLFSDTERMKSIITPKYDGVSVVYGDELPIDNVENACFISTKYYAGSAVSGVLRVVCPQTVDYERLFAAVEYFAGLLTRSITGFERK